MNQVDIYRLLELNEHEGLEFKKSSDELSKDFWPTYSAFANTTGGDIVLGVAEKKGRFDLVGVTDWDKIKSDLYSQLSNPNRVSYNVISERDIEIFEINGKIIAKIHVSEAPLSEKPVYLKGNIFETYIRRHSGDYQAKKDEVTSFIRNQKDDLDNELLEGYTIDDLDSSSVKAYKAKLLERYPESGLDTKSEEEFLINIGVIRLDYNDQRKPKLTLGGLLFLGKYNAIRARLPHYHVDYLDRRGNSERWRDRIDSMDLSYPNLNLFNYYTLVYDRLLSTVENGFYLDEKMVRKSQSELKIAIREAFVNMIVHADYLSTSASLVAEVYEPYYIFSNPGIMKIPVEEFFRGAKSNPRNSILVSLFTRMGAAERAGSGSQKIQNIVIKNNFKEPELETNIEETKLKLWTVQPAEVYPELSDVEQVIYNIISDTDDIKGLSKKNIQDMLKDNNEYTVKAALNRLTSLNLIEKVGGNRNRTYRRVMSTLEMMKKIDDISKGVMNMLLETKSKNL